jgi:hypothetical protein
VKAGELNTIPEAGKQRPKAPAAPAAVDLAELLAQSMGGKKSTRAANENHKRPRKARASSKAHETQHRKSA